MTTTKKIDFGDRSWAAHAQDHWLHFAGNPNFPDYLRVTFVAYGRHAANGHARLNRGELLHFLMRKDGTLPDRRKANSAVSEAVDLGYLAVGSGLLCLVVPAHAVQGGQGNPDARCPRNHAKREPSRTTNDRGQHGRFLTNDGAERGRSDTNDGAEHGRSVLRVSSSSPTSGERSEAAS